MSQTSTALEFARNAANYLFERNQRNAPFFQNVDKVHKLGIVLVSLAIVLCSLTIGTALYLNTLSQLQVIILVSGALLTLVLGILGIKGICYETDASLQKKIQEKELVYLKEKGLKEFSLRPDATTIITKNALIQLFISDLVDIDGLYNLLGVKKGECGIKDLIDSNNPWKLPCSEVESIMRCKHFPDNLTFASIKEFQDYLYSREIFVGHMNFLLSISNGEELINKFFDDSDFQTFLDFNADLSVKVDWRPIELISDERLKPKFEQFLDERPTFENIMTIFPKFWHVLDRSFTKNINLDKMPSADKLRAYWTMHRKNDNNSSR